MPLWVQVCEESFLLHCRLNSTFLLFTFEKGLRRVKICPIPSMPWICIYGLQLQPIRSKKPILCLNNTHPQLCGDTDIYNATKLRGHLGVEEFMAVWNWKLNPSTCLEFQINYTCTSHKDILYYTSSARTDGYNYNREEIHAIPNQSILVPPKDTSVDITLVLVHRSQQEFKLEFKAIKLNDDECFQRCLP